MRHAILAALLGATLLAGCGGGDDAPAGKPATTDTIDIEDFVFEPASATVRAGQKITVANADAAPHTLTARPAGGAPGFDTGVVRGRTSGSFTASKAGTYAIVCELHPFMKGTITVVS